MKKFRAPWPISRAIGGAGMVMDIQTGELLALVSLPDFDPAQPGDGDRRCRVSTARRLGTYEMGSTFKLFNTAIGLDTGATTLAGGYDATACHQDRPLLNR